MTNPYMQFSRTNVPWWNIRVPVVPSDTEDNIDGGSVAIGLFIQGGGTISYIDHFNETRNEVVPDFYELFGPVKRVLATGTTATGIIAFARRDEEVPL